MSHDHRDAVRRDLDKPAAAEHRKKIAKEFLDKINIIGPESRPHCGNCIDPESCEEQGGCLYPPIRPRGTDDTKPK